MKRKGREGSELWGRLGLTFEVNKGKGGLERKVLEKNLGRCFERSEKERKVRRKKGMNGNCKERKE